jgi:hypothetical protein
LIEETKKANEDLKHQYDEFLESKNKFESEQKELKIYEIKENVINLNVGGKKFSTLKSTLLKPRGSLLAALFSGRYKPCVKDKEGL